MNVINIPFDGISAAIRKALVAAFFEIARWLAIVFLILWFIGQSPLGRDPTDESGWFGARSGMGFRVDHETGCQYLEGTNGGLSPRLDAEGYHLGCKPYEDEEPSLNMSLRLIHD